MSILKHPVLLQVLMQFSNNSGFAAIFDVIKLFCPLLGD